MMGHEVIQPEHPDKDVPQDPKSSIADIQPPPLPGARYLTPAAAPSNQTPLLPPHLPGNHKKSTQQGKQSRISEPPPLRIKAPTRLSPPPLPTTHRVGNNSTYPQSSVFQNERIEQRSVVGEAASSYSTSGLTISVILLISASIVTLAIMGSINSGLGKMLERPAAINSPNNDNLSTQAQTVYQAPHIASPPPQIQAPKLPPVPTPEELYQKALDVNGAKRITLLEQAAEAGHTNAMLDLGKMYRDGVDIPANNQAAVKWYSMAADSGELAEVLTQAETYLKKQNKLALIMFEAAANAGHNESIYQIAIMYDTGILTQVDNNKAVYWLRKAAYAKYPDAMWRLGNHYHSGVGIAKSDFSAAYWYKEGTKAQHVRSMVNLAHLTYRGRGVEQDYSEAFRLYQAAAAQDDAEAMMMLGRCYELGKGIPVDIAMARAWYKKAVVGGNIQAKEYLGQ